MYRSDSEVLLLLLVLFIFREPDIWMGWNIATTFLHVVPVLFYLPLLFCKLCPWNGAGSVSGSSSYAMQCYLWHVEGSGGPCAKNKVVRGAWFSYSMPGQNSIIRHWAPGSCFHLLPVINPAGHFMSLLLHVQMWLEQHSVSSRAGCTFQFLRYFRNPPFQDRALRVGLSWLISVGMSSSAMLHQDDWFPNTWALGLPGELFPFRLCSSVTSAESRRAEAWPHLLFLFALQFLGQLVTYWGGNWA